MESSRAQSQDSVVAGEKSGKLGLCGSLWRVEKKIPPQDPGTKRRNLGHPTRYFELWLVQKFTRLIDEEIGGIRSLISGAPGESSQKRLMFLRLFPRNEEQRSGSDVPRGTGWHLSSEPRIHKHTNCRRLTLRMMQKKGAAPEILVSYDSVRGARGQLKGWATAAQSTGPVAGRVGLRKCRIISMETLRLSPSFPKFPSFKFERAGVKAAPHASQKPQTSPSLGSSIFLRVLVRSTVNFLSSIALHIG